jgi:beta-glucanase (GH16 family)
MKDFSQLGRGTNNLEWYDPQQLTTKDGHLVITLDKTPNHELDYMGGMMSTWNKFCFTGGIIVTSVTLPSKSSIYGLWVRQFLLLGV